VPARSGIIRWWGGSALFSPIPPFFCLAFLEERPPSSWDFHRQRWCTWRFPLVEPPFMCVSDPFALPSDGIAETNATSADGVMAVWRAIDLRADQRGTVPVPTTEAQKRDEVWPSTFSPAMPPSSLPVLGYDAAYFLSFEGLAAKRNQPDTRRSPPPPLLCTVHLRSLQEVEFGGNGGNLLPHHLPARWIPIAFPGLLSSRFCYHLSSAC